MIRSGLGVFAIGTIGVVTAPTSSASASTITVVDSSFENPVIGVAGSSSATITGWTKQGSVQLVTPSLGPPGPFTAEDGLQAVFTGISGPGLITQTLVPIVPGASYILSAYVSLLGVQNAGGNYTLTIGYEPGGTYATYTPFAIASDAQGPLSSSWLFTSISGVAPLSASGALAITLGGDGEFWDNVSVTEESVAPLPSTWLMMLTALTGLVFVAYRRQKQNGTWLQRDHRRKQRSPGQCLGAFASPRLLNGCGVLRLLPAQQQSTWPLALLPASKCGPLFSQHLP
jgi:hypothetical protein